MTDKLANLVQQTTVTPGAGALTLGVSDGFRTFAAAFGSGSETDRFYYFIVDAAGDAWEYGTGHMSDATTLARDTVLGSSNADQLVNFGPGKKTVVNDLPAEFQASHTATGLIAQGDGIAISGEGTSEDPYVIRADMLAGGDMSIQYNDNGTSGGDSNFIWDKNKRLFAAGDLKNNFGFTQFNLNDTNRTINFNAPNSVNFDSSAIYVAGGNYTRTLQINTVDAEVILGDIFNDMNGSKIGVNDTAMQAYMVANSILLDGTIEATALAGWGTRMVVADASGAVLPGEAYGVFSADIETPVIGNGFVATSPDGTRYRLSPPNGGGPASWAAV